MNGHGDRKIAFAEFELDSGLRRLTREGETVPLHSKAFDLLEYFVNNGGRILTKDEILETVWDGKFVEESNLAVQISNLRKALGESKDNARFLVTVPGKGYKFAAGLQHDITVIETHTVSELTIEREEYAEFTPSLPFALRSARNSWRVAAGVGFVALIAVVAIGFVTYRGQALRSTVASPWLEPSRNVQRRQLTANGRVNVASISPDGTLFAYTNEGSEESGLWVVGINGTQTVEVLAPEARTFYGLTFSPDGMHIYYSVRDDKNLSGSLFRVPAFGGMSEKILSDIQVPVTFSPDGREIAFVRELSNPRGSAMVIATVNAPIIENVLVERPNGLEFSLSGASWSPDGTKIAIGGKHDGETNFVILIVDKASGSVARFGDGMWNHVRRVQWTPDGSGLFVNSIDKKYWQERQITMIEYPSGREHRITNDLTRYGAETVAISADGSRMVGVSAQTVSNIFVAESDDLKTFRQVTQNALGKNDGNWNSLAWTPDNKLVFMRFFDKSDTLWSMNADGTDAKQLTPAGNLDRKPVVTADGSTIVYYTNKDGKAGLYNIWRMNADGTDARQLTQDGGFVPSLSPDDQLIYFQQGSSIMRVSINGGTPDKLTYKPSRGVDVSPDGKYFATFYRPADKEKLKLAIFPINGGEPLHQFDTAADLPFEKMRWTPDSKSVVYCFYNSTAWKQNIAGGPPEKFLEFPGEIINAFDWSLDGKQFAVAHGQELRDVVLFSIDR